MRAAFSIVFNINVAREYSLIKSGNTWVFRSFRIRTIRKFGKSIKTMKKSDVIQPSHWAFSLQIFLEWKRLEKSFCALTRRRCVREKTRLRLVNFSRSQHTRIQVEGSLQPKFSSIFPILRHSLIELWSMIFTSLKTNSFTEVRLQNTCI